MIPCRKLGLSGELISLISLVNAAIGEGDRDALRKAAHSLKSRSANLGAMRLSGFCKEMESRGRTNRLEDAPELLSEAEAECKQVLAALAAETGAP